MAETNIKISSAWRHQRSLCKPLNTDREDARYKKLCLNKVAHDTFEEADKERQRLERVYAPYTFRAFGCEFCGRYHNGRLTENYAEEMK